MGKRTFRGMFEVEFEIELDDAVIDGYLSSLPGQICANVTIYDGNQIVSNHLRPGCNGKTQTASARRSFLAEDKVYMAEAEVYYA